LEVSKYMNTRHRDGALRDRLDIRDYPIGDYLGKAPLPEEIDLSDKMLSVRDQGQEPVCVAFAAVAVKEWQEGFRLSPRFLYDRIAQPGGGAYPRDAMRILADTGVPEEECQPYIPNKPTPPCEDALKRAAPNKIRTYARLTTIDEMCRCLVEHGPFIASFGINESWYDPKLGVVVDGDKETGGHAVAVVGYNNATQLLKFRNSWQENWGNKDYGYISYSAAISTLWDAWSVVDIPNEDEEGGAPNPPEPQPQPQKSLIEHILDWIRSIINYLFPRKGSGQAT
jgi:C1A family cysteine protease